MNVPFRTTSLVAALLAAGAAVAAPRGDTFERIDTDKDGAISQAEHAAHHAEMTAGLDANNDGQVTFEEAQAHRERQREERMRARFAKHDSNGDGKVTMEEFDARGDAMFQRMDKNADGKLTEDEMRAGHGMHRGDGKRGDGMRDGMGHGHHGG